MQSASFLLTQVPIQPQTRKREAISEENRVKCMYKGTYKYIDPY